MLIVWWLDWRKSNFYLKKNDLFSCRQSKYACLHDIMFVDMHFYGWFLCILSIWILILERKKKYIICINVCLIWFCRLVPLLSTLYVVSYRHRMPTVWHTYLCAMSSAICTPATITINRQPLEHQYKHSCRAHKSHWHTIYFNDIKLSKKNHYLRLDIWVFRRIYCH